MIDNSVASSLPITKWQRKPLCKVISIILLPRKKNKLTHSRCGGKEVMKKKEMSL